MATSTTEIPFLYRFMFLYYEPAAAVLGSALLHFNPTVFLSSVTHNAVYTASNQVIFDMLAATYLLFAFNEAVLLRVTSDLTVWRTVLLGILICDAAHLYSSWADLGADVFWNPLLWRAGDAVNLGTLWGQGALRVAFILGLGFPKLDKQKVS
ncbi:hypothetical protein BX600DRAFT_504826 [Xylariales sp. PMI_506]|nr:hypothetical protein BX600DRAFT_504826 [Xylariales sp. PMI_506]